MTAVADQARQAEQEGDKAAAAKYLEQYIFLEPTDTDARGRYALLLYRDPAASSKQMIRAYVTLEDVLRRDADKPEVRRAAAELAVRFRRYKEAREHVDVLTRQNPGDPELLLLKGQCEIRAGSPDEAIKALTQIGEVAPDKVELCRTAAELLRRNLQRPVAANRVIEQMVGKAPESGPARQAAARYYAGGQPPDSAQVEQHTRYALDTLKAQNAELSVLAAQAAMTQKQLDRAKTVLENGLKQYPDDLHLRQLLARVELMSGHREKAREAVAPAAAANAPKSLNDLWAQASLMIDLDQPDRVAELVKQIEALGGPTPAAAAACLNGHLLVRQKKWNEARLVLEKGGRRRRPSRTWTAWSTSCWPSVIPSREIRTRPRSPTATCSRSTRPMSRPAEAWPWPRRRWARRTRRSSPGGVLATQKPDARADLARILLVHNRRKPAAERDWTEFNQTLEAMSVEEKNSPAGRQLRIDGLLAQDKADDVRKLVEAERDHDPKQVGPWTAGRPGRPGKDPNAVPTLLAEAERQAGWHVEWELARLAQAIRTAGGMPVEKVSARLKAIESAGLRGSDAEKARLLGGLADASTRIGDRANAKRLWKEAVEKSAEKLPLQFTLFEMALQDGDTAEAARLRDDIRKAEGAEGPVGLYCEAACQTFEAQKTTGSLAAARTALNRAAEQRPSWGRIALLDGDLCESEGRRDKALEKYQEAMEHGEMRLPVVRRVLQLLYEQHRYAEAHALLKKLPEPAVSQSNWADRRRAECGQPRRGRRRRNRRQGQGPADGPAVDCGRCEGLSWTTLARPGRPSGPAKPPRARPPSARRSSWPIPSPKPGRALPCSWPGPTEKGRGRVEKAKAKLAKDQLPLVLARATSAGPGRAGRGPVPGRPRRQADRPGRDAGRRLPSTPGPARPPRPSRSLKQLIDDQTQAPATTKAWARRALAVSLSAAGTYQQFQEAVGLIDVNARGGTLSDEDRLTKALNPGPSAGPPQGRDPMIPNAAGPQGRRRRTPS